MTRFRVLQTFALVMGCFFFWPVPLHAQPPDPKERVFLDKLLSRMSLDEKIGQLSQYTADMAVTGSSVRENYREDIKGGRVGSIFNAYGPKFTRELQKLAVEGTKNKIPLLFGHDVIHGHHTTFPIPLGESSSWDLGLIEATARAAAREASADGIHWTFAPMVDISREPRWGRIMEGAGEDTYLGAKIAAARVKGFQGDDLRALDRVMACAKHFAAYGAPLAGREYNTADMSERELRETFLPPFKAAIDAGVATIMTAINELNGVPAASNRWLMADVLRKQLKFMGFVVSDYTTVNELVPHGVAKDLKDAARLAFNAGTDMDMQGGVYHDHLASLVREGKVSAAQINTSARRVLEAKYRRGLFSDPYRFSDDARAEAEQKSTVNRALGRESARRSLVLLKNEGDILPLKRGQTIALIGPMADNQREQIGNWSAAGDWKTAVSLRRGLAEVGGDKLKILYAKGSDFLTDPELIKFLNVHGDGHIEIDSRGSIAMIEEAIAVAKKADVIVLALGETQGMSGEATSRTRIRLPENQQELLRALKKVGKPIVTVIYGGRPLALEGESLFSQAMLEAWLPGLESGRAIADVLLGDYNPSGRLTITFPRNEGQIPIFYAQKNTGRPLALVQNLDHGDSRFKFTSRYIDSPNTPLYPFGFGLSYSKFEYSNLRLSGDTIGAKGKTRVMVDLVNSGKMGGEETVQMYVHDLVASITRPVKLLRGFAKVQLAPGEKKTVEIPLTVEDLKFYDQNMHWIAEKGEFSVYVGPNSAEGLETKLTLR